MVIVRSPLRITLGGGGTDLPSYYEKNEGFLISAAIDKYVYITLHDNFEKEIYLKLLPDFIRISYKIIFNKFIKTIINHVIL